MGQKVGESAEISLAITHWDEVLNINGSKACLNKSAFKIIKFH